MPKLAANISLLFAELPYLDRFDAASEAGFDGVEILFPYEVAARETQRALTRNALPLVLMNAPPPNYTGGVPGYAAIPGGETRFQHDMRRVLRYAEALRPGRIHVMAGKTEEAGATETMIANLQWLADFAPRQAFTIEPLNQHDQPGYALSDYRLAAEILGAVDRPNVTLQYDSYHAQVIHGDALTVWETYGHLAGHVQLGDAPGRCEPGGGTIDFAALFEAIRGSGYDGWMSAEYRPTTARTDASLDWRALLG